MFAIFFELFPLILLSACSFFLIISEILTKSLFLGIFLLLTGYVISIRFFLMYIIFYKDFFKTIFPTILLPVTIYSSVFVFEPIKFPIIALSLLFSSIFLGATVLFLRYIDKIGLKMLNFNSFQILTSYLQSWTSSIPNELEEILEKYSKPSMIKTYQINLNQNGRKLALVIPGIHPGPFSPIGSYNLPSDVISFFKEKSIPSMVFHTPSSHAINLPSRKEVEDYLNSIVIKKDDKFTEDNICSKPLRVSKNKATVTGLMFNNTALVFLSLAPYGAEDFPPEIIDYTKQFIEKNILDEIILIDAHNALGDTILDDDLNDIKNCLSDLIQELKVEPKGRFSFNFVSLDHLEFKEIGPGGAGCLCLTIDNNNYLLYSIDSNNSIPSLKNNLEQALYRKGLFLLEICTTDSHFLSGKTKTKKGYYALGELSSEEEIIKKLVDPTICTRDNQINANFEIECHTSNVKTIGQEQINLYSKFMNKMLSFSLKGAILLVLLSILLLAIFIEILYLGSLLL
jgi:putative membrane protein